MQQSKKYLFFLTGVATLGGLLFGYDTAVISGTVKYLQINFIDPLCLSETASNSLLGFVVSSALIGCIAGGFLGGVMASRFGRKKSLFIAAILFILSALGSAFPEMLAGKGDLHTFLPHFIVYRILGGIGVGLASMISPMYIAEIAPADKRGKLVSFNQLAIVIGIAVIYFVNYLIAVSGDEQWITHTGWRMMFLSGTIPAALLFMLVLFIPESPRWLVMKGQEEKAAAIIGRINGGQGVGEQVASIRESLGGVTKSKLFSCGAGIVVLGIALAVFQQITGINVVMYYAPEIFRKMGMETNSAMLQTIIVGVINVLFTVIAISTVDRLGRRPLMIVGSTVMATSMILLGTLFFFNSLGVAALIVMLCYTAVFSMSWGPVTWVLLSEIFPNKIRGQAMSIAVALQWVANYFVSWTFPMMHNSTYLTDLFHGGFAYWIYGFMAILSGLFIWKFIPETKGRTLEEMNKIFDKKSSRFPTAH